MVECERVPLILRVSNPTTPTDEAPPRCPRRRQRAPAPCSSRGTGGGCCSRYRAWVDVELLERHQRSSIARLATPSTRSRWRAISALAIFTRRWPEVLEQHRVVVAPQRHHGVDQLDLIVIGHGCLPDDGKAKRCVVLRRAVLRCGEARRGETWRGTGDTRHSACTMPLAGAGVNGPFLRP